MIGRLYYHLEREYGEHQRPDGGPLKHFFAPKVGDDVNAVNFPFLEAVLAGLWEQRRRDRLALWTALFSLGIERFTREELLEIGRLLWPGLSLADSASSQ